MSWDLSKRRRGLNWSSCTSARFLLVWLLQRSPLQPSSMGLRRQMRRLLLLVSFVP